MPLFQLGIYVKVCVIPQIFSKSTDTWLCNFAHLFNLMTPTCRQEAVLCQAFWQIYAPFGLRIYFKVFQFSKSIDIWLWSFAHLFTIMTPTCRQEEVTVLSMWQNISLFNLKFTFKFAYHLKYFQKLLTSGFKTCWNFIFFSKSIIELSSRPITVTWF
jgi:hypothetical protein